MTSPRTTPARHPTLASIYEVRPIGVVSSPFKVHIGTPRQPRVGPPAEGEIHLRRGMQNTVKDLAAFSHVWVIFWFCYSRGWNEQVRPPRDAKKRGVLATRSPHRPNAIGLSLLRLLGVRGCRLAVADLDLLDGTPVLDLKPYLPYADRVDDARVGWVEELEGPDHRPWQ
jgi:tRNA-Thr(GGU) m(6)t(6)A37 methyltransferase TsaA